MPKPDNRPATIARRRGVLACVSTDHGEGHTMFRMQMPALASATTRLRLRSGVMPAARAAGITLAVVAVTATTACATTAARPAAAPTDLAAQPAVLPTDLPAPVTMPSSAPVASQPAKPAMAAG